MVSSTRKSVFIVMFLVLLLTLSSFAFASTTLFNKDIDKDKKKKDKYDYVTVDGVGDVYYKDNKVKYITDLDLNTYKIKDGKNSLEFLDIDTTSFSVDDYVIKDKVIGFNSEKYKDKAKDKLTNFMNPVIVGEEQLGVAKVTFNLSDEIDSDFNETSIALIYKTDSFTDNYDDVISTGYLVDVVEFTGQTVEYYADSFSTFAVVTLITNAPANVNHADITFVPKYYGQIDNPDGLTYSILTQVKQVLDANYQTLESLSLTNPQSLGTYTLSVTDLPETHVRYRYRIAFLEDGVLYTTATQPTFDVGVVVSNGDSSSITDTSAVLEGNIGSSLNGYSSLSCGFQYREDGTSTWSESGETTVSSLYSDYTRTITGLDPETTYEWRSICWDARNGIYVPAGGNMDDWYSLTETFTTEAGTPTNPNVATDPATSIGDTTATLNGDLTTLGDETSVTGRFLYRETGTTTYTTATDQTLTSTGSYSSAITGLTACTNYEYFARVAYGLDVDDGTTETFTTTGCTTPETGIINFWSLMDSLTLGVEDQVGSNDATNNGATYDSGDDAFEFDGVDDYLGITNPLSTSSITINVWVNTDESVDNMYLVNNYGIGSTDNWFVTEIQNDKLIFQIDDGSAVDTVTGSTNIPDNTWIM